MTTSKSPRRVLKVAYEAACRGLAEHLGDHPDLCRLIDLKAVPHCTTLPKAAQRLLAASPGCRARIEVLLADADFDGAWVHEHVRSYGIRILIPPERTRPSDKLPAGRWRRRMKQRFDRRKYGPRWQTETVSSMIKRRLGSALRARSYWSQCREIILRVITHNVMIVIRVRVFYRAISETFW